MRNRKNYRLGFDPWGFGLFLLIMLPNLVWFAVPAPNDILRAQSATPLLDSIGQVFQVIMVAALCAVRNIAPDKPMKHGFQNGVFLPILLYFIGWRAYASGVVIPIVILSLTLAPCAAFLVFALGRKNVPALLAAASFTTCHLISSVINFIL